MKCSQKEREGISVECQPLACRQYTLHSRRGWGGGGSLYVEVTNGAIMVNGHMGTTTTTQLRREKNRHD